MGVNATQKSTIDAILSVFEKPFRRRTGGATLSSSASASEEALRMFRSLPALLVPILALLLWAVPPRAAGAADDRSSGPVLLTVAGAIETTNRGPFDPFHDAYLARLVDPFERAHAFDAAALAALPQQELVAAYPGWDGEHRFSGPSVADLLTAVGATGLSITFVGLDGYAATYERAVLEKAGFLLATHLDGEPMAVGGFGPAWLMVSPEIEPAFEDGKPSEAGLVWSTFFVLVE